jgi:hypothetical protein
MALSVHVGHTFNSRPFTPAVRELREDFDVERMVMVGDRGMVSQVAIDEMRKMDGIGWITALKSASIHALIEQGHLQMGLFDERNLLELSSPDYPEVAKLRAHARPRWTGGTSSAPRYPPRSWMCRSACATTRRWPTGSAPSNRSRRSS